MTNFQTQNVQPYTFTASTTGSKSNLRFVIVDPLGAVQSTNADDVAVSGSVSNGQIVTLTVTYKNTLSDVGSIVYGTTNAQAVNVKKYAIYNAGTKDLTVPLNVKIQDCACCGAYVAAGVWKTFLCHNLGADDGLDPFVSSQGINGGYYQWGRRDMVADASTPAGAVNPWNATFPSNTALSDNAKTENDPCPAGYRIPTMTQWRGVMKNNAYTFIGTWTESVTEFNSGLKLGKLLFLPAAGGRYWDGYTGNQGKLTGRNKFGRYWSSTYYSSEVASMYYFYSGSKSTDDPQTLERKTFGVSIRCIEQ